MAILRVFFLALMFCLSTKTERLFSNYKTCGDTECQRLLSRVQATKDYKGPDCRFLNFQKGNVIFVYHKLSGQRDDLWAGSLDKQFGYFPKDAVQVEEIYISTDKELNIATQKQDFFCLDEYGGIIEDVQSHSDLHRELHEEVDSDSAYQSLLHPELKTVQEPSCTPENTDVLDKVSSQSVEQGNADPQPAEPGGSYWIGSGVTGWLGLGGNRDGAEQDKAQEQDSFRSRKLALEVGNNPLEQDMETKTDTWLTGRITQAFGFGEKKADPIQDDISLEPQGAWATTPSPKEGKDSDSWLNLGIGQIWSLGEKAKDNREGMREGPSLDSQSPTTSLNSDFEQTEVETGLNKETSLPTSLENTGGENVLDEDKDQTNVNTGWYGSVYSGIVSLYNRETNHDAEDDVSKAPPQTSGSKLSSATDDGGIPEEPAKSIQSLLSAGRISTMIESLTKFQNVHNDIQNDEDPALELTVKGKNALEDPPINVSNGSEDDSTHYLDKEGDIYLDEPNNSSDKTNFQPVAEEILSSVGQIVEPEMESEVQSEPSVDITEYSAHVTGIGALQAEKVVQEGESRLDILSVETFSAQNKNKTEDALNTSETPDKSDIDSLNSADFKVTDPTDLSITFVPEQSPLAGEVDDLSNAQSKDSIDKHEQGSSVSLEEYSSLGPHNPRTDNSKKMAPVKDSTDCLAQSDSSVETDKTELKAAVITEETLFQMGTGEPKLEQIHDQTLREVTFENSVTAATVETLHIENADGEQEGIKNKDFKVKKFDVVEIRGIQNHEDTEEDRENKAGHIHINTAHIKYMVDTKEEAYHISNETSPPGEYKRIETVSLEKDNSFVDKTEEQVKSQTNIDGHSQTIRADKTRTKAENPAHNSNSKETISEAYKNNFQTDSNLQTELESFGAKSSKESMLDLTVKIENQHSKSVHTSIEERHSEPFGQNEQAHPGQEETDVYRNTRVSDYPRGTTEGANGEGFIEMHMPEEVQKLKTETQFTFEDRNPIPHSPLGFMDSQSEQNIAKDEWSNIKRIVEVPNDGTVKSDFTVDPEYQGVACDGANSKECVTSAKTGTFTGTKQEDMHKETEDEHHKDLNQFPSDDSINLDKNLATENLQGGSKEANENQKGRELGGETQHTVVKEVLPANPLFDTSPDGSKKPTKPILAILSKSDIRHTITEQGSKDFLDKVSHRDASDVSTHQDNFTVQPSSQRKESEEELVEHANPPLTSEEIPQPAEEDLKPSKILKEHRSLQKHMNAGDIHNLLNVFAKSKLDWLGYQLENLENERDDQDVDHDLIIISDFQRLLQYHAEMAPSSKDTFAAHIPFQKLQALLSTIKHKLTTKPPATSVNSNQDTETPGCLGVTCRSSEPSESPGKEQSESEQVNKVWSMASEVIVTTAGLIALKAKQHAEKMLPLLDWTIQVCSFLQDVCFPFKVCGTVHMLWLLCKQGLQLVLPDKAAGVK